MEHTDSDCRRYATQDRESFANHRAQHLPSLSRNSSHALWFSSFRVQWQIVNKPGFTDGPRVKYSDKGMSPYLWNEALMGAQGDWQDAGRGALGLGVIAVIALGFALLFTLVSLAKPDFSKAPASIMAFIAGFAFLLGAVIYEGVRPSWGGDMVGAHAHTHATHAPAFFLFRTRAMRLFLDNVLEGCRLDAAAKTNAASSCADRFACCALLALCSLSRALSLCAQGYNHPIGLYLAAGLMAEIACIVLWSADFTGAKRYDNTRL